MKVIKMLGVGALAAVVAISSGCSKKPEQEKPALDAKAAAQKYDKIREEMKALYLVQSILGWYVRTNGERSVFEETYKGRESLFSKENVEFFNEYMKMEGLNADDRRAAKYMRNALLAEFVAIDTAHFYDKVNDAEASATVKLEWVGDPVPYRQLDSMKANETDPERRRALQEAEALVWKESLNPILAKEEERIQELAVEIGYKSFVELSEEYREINLKEFMAETQKFFDETDEMYGELFAAEVQEVMGFPAEKFTRADILYFAAVPAFQKYFPAELTIPAFESLISGMGIDLKTIAGTEITIDDEIREKKNPRAACFSISVPDDIRVTVKPSGGIPDFETFFHEGGHALHYANTNLDKWEFQQLGNNAVTEGYAIFMENIWGDYEWLLKYREIVREHNKTLPASKRVPVMSDAEIGKLIRNRVLWKMYMVRRYNWAKLIYETLLHGGGAEYFGPYYDGPENDPHQAYRRIFSKAYGFELTENEALRFRTDVDSFFYAADYARAFLLSEQIEEKLRKDFGPQWFNDPRAGEFVKKQLWALGNKPSSEDISKAVGAPDLNYDIFTSRIREQLAIADRLMGKK
ncbi:MAG TPA: hypothetical protein PKH33_11185 [bacterium]|nr:hypothetical protein [bacterium]